MVMDTLQTWRNDQPKCFACGETMYPEHGQLVYKLRGYTITVTNVPLHVCPVCEEQVVPGHAGVQAGSFVKVVMDQIDELSRS